MTHTYLWYMEKEVKLCVTARCRSDWKGRFPSGQKACVGDGKPSNACCCGITATSALHRSTSAVPAMCKAWMHISVGHATISGAWEHNLNTSSVWHQSADQTGKVSFLVQSKHVFVKNSSSAAIKHLLLWNHSQKHNEPY